MATIRGTSGNDVLNGTAGDDTIEAYGGNNTVNAGNGRNRITAGSGNDTITSGTGDDTIDAGDGNNTIDAGDGRNTIDTGIGNDVITTGLGDDTIDAGDGDNRVNAGAGANRITTGKGADIITAGAGNDTIKAGEGHNFVDAGAGHNTITAGAGNDTIRTLGGNDTISAGGGTNVVEAGDGNNCVTSGSGADTITTGSGNDVIQAGDGANVVNAGNGNNSVDTGSGNDAITTGSGNDCIDAGRGDNTVNAGDGNNTVTAGSGNDRITTGAGNDVILAGDGLNVIDAGGGNNIVTTCDDADQVKTGSGHDLIYTGGGNDFVDSGAGNDIVFLDGGNDTVRHDVTANRNSCDIYWGGSGTDTLQLVLTAAQLADPAIQADIARFNATGGGNFLGFFCFNSINLTTWSFEKLVVVAPVDAIDDVTTVGEDATVVINVLGNDKDLGAADNSALRVTGFNQGSLPGTLTLNSNGTFTYVPGAAYQSLAAGETALASFTYTIADDQGFTDTATVRITITGANDAPVFALAPAAGQVVEGGPVATGGTIAFTDVDSSDTHSVSFTPAGSGYLGTFTATKAADSTGGATGQVAWNFTVDPAAIAYLNNGETLTQTYQVKVDDGKGGTAIKSVVVTIVGTNGSPVANADVATTGENAGIVIAVLANDSDPDGDALTVTSVSAPAGKGTVSTNGTTVSFDPGTAFDHLAAGASEVVTLTYAISDGHGGTATSTVALTVTGTNDAPVVTGPLSASASEGGAIASLDALANASDIDDGAVLTAGDFRIGVGGPAGLPAGVTYNAATHTLSLDPSNAAYNALTAGQVVTVTVAYTVSDGTASVPTTAVFTVTGANDLPVVIGAVTGTAVEDGLEVTLNALANASDPDAGTTLSVVLGGPLPAGVSYNPSTSSFTLNPGSFVFQSLAEGETIVVSYDYLISDGTGTTPASVSWTLTGTNDGPVITSPPATGNVAEAGVNPGNTPAPGTPTATGLFTSSDLDDGATATWTGSANGTYGSLAVAANGAWTYTLDNGRAATQALARGQGATDSFFVTVTDDKGATATQGITINVSGENDAPTAVNDTATVGETGLVLLDLAANDGDVDLGAVRTYALTGAPIAGLSLDPSGAVDYSAAANSLAQGETQTVVADYVVTDQFGASATAQAIITVVGENDAPVVGGPVTGTATEDGAASTLSALATASDVDTSNTLSVVLGGALPAGVSFDAATQSFTLDPSNAAFQSLGEGVTTTVTYSYGVSDGVVMVPTSVSWTVTGTNDAPVVGPAQSVTISEDDAPFTFDALAGSSDPDSTLQVVNIFGSPDGVSYNAATHSFTLDPSHPTYQALAAGQSTTVSVSYGVSDGTTTVPTSVSWTINGANDGPVANPVDGKVSGGSATVNLMLILDLSGSMTENVGGGQTRLSLAKAALNNLINAYDAKGEVAVRLVGFGDNANDFGGRWLTAAEARAEIADFIADGQTNYDYAVQRAREAFLAGEGRIAGGQNLSYFLSDGVPNEGTNLPGNPTPQPGPTFVGLNAFETLQWTDFLNANDVNSFAIGIGAGISPSNVATYMNSIAYNGVTGADTNAVAVPDLTGLAPLLVGLANAPVSGNLLTNASPQGSFGPDDPGYVQSITIAGTTFTLDFAANTVTSSGAVRAFSYDPATHVLATTDQTGGALTINLHTGDYSFTVPSNFALGAQSSVAFTLADLFGATASSTLSLNNDGVRDDLIITNLSGALSVADAALLANDIDQSGAVISLSAIAQGSGGTASRLSTSTVYTFDVGATVGTFSYTGQSSTGSDQATVTIDASQAGSTTLNGTAGDDIIIVSNVIATTIDAGAGDDRVFGSSFADTYVVGLDDGFDIVTDGSSGNAIRVEGTGDLGTFEVRLGTDPGSISLTNVIYSIGESVVQVNGGTGSVIGLVQFQAGASVYGHTLAAQYGAGGLSGGAGFGQIFRPIGPSTLGNTVTWTGTGFDDIMFGGGGIDAINGGAGNDILIGGDQADRLTGGAGSDTFVFLNSGNGTPQGVTPVQPLPETILDFEVGVDKISLFAIDANPNLAGDDAFAFVAAQGSTTSVVANSITWSRTDANTVQLRIDTNGDTTADLVINVSSLAASYTPTIGDFIL